MSIDTVRKLSEGLVRVSHKLVKRTLQAAFASLWLAPHALPRTQWTWTCRRQIIRFMPHPGEARRRIAFVLRSAYGEGLLSERTLLHRLGLLFGGPIVEPNVLIGDLTRTESPHSLGSRARWTLNGLARAVARLRNRDAMAPAVLALDWAGGCERLMVGRLESCDVVLGDPTVSRLHAELTFRDGGWVIRDLDSTNGTTVNGATVIRCRILPGDELCFGEQRLVVD